MNSKISILLICVVLLAGCSGVDEDNHPTSIGVINEDGDTPYCHGMGYERGYAGI